MFRILIKSLLVIITSVLFVASLFYINTTIYNFPPSSPFSGDYWYNPYNNLPDSSYRANFHAHSIAWKEVTNGHNTEKDLFDGYTNKGYQIAGISNYHNISTYGKSRTDLYVPVYEHGYNIFKSHCLAINSPKVSYFDYPLYQLTSHKQKIINNIKENGALVAMAHPKFTGGRSFEDMENLVGYDFTEVLNHYRVSDEHWDKALSAGRLTWVMGNDDTHDLVKEPTFLIWNIIRSAKRSADDVMHSMKKGQNYAIKSFNGQCDNELSSCEVNGNEMKFCLTNKANSIELVGQNGKIVATASQSDSIVYNAKSSDTYIRLVARNNSSDLYLNPIIRYDGSNIPLNSEIKATTNVMATWAFRILAIIFSLSLLFLIRKIIRF